MPQYSPLATASANTLLEALSRLEGLDTSLGLGNAGGNLSLYANLLHNFLIGQSQTSARIRRNMDQGESLIAKRLVHILKGVAATLGASRLSASAAALEQLLFKAIEGPAQVDAQVLEPALADTERRLNALLDGLRPLSAPLNSAAKKAPPMQVPSPSLLHTIGELLAEDDARALELWQAHAEILKVLVPHGELMDRAIRNFDFDQALQLLRTD